MTTLFSNKIMPNRHLMMRLLVAIPIIFGFIFGTQPAYSQSINAAEYFFDTDPGTGLATAITIGSPADSISISTNIPSTGLNCGFHYLFIRTREDNGQWSLHEGRRLYVQPTIVAAEYFFDVDPGAGNAHPLSVSTSYDSISFSGSVSATGLSSGNHWLYVRTRNNSGGWSMYERRAFYIKPQIISAEYFIDTDPGIGNGTAVAVTASEDSIAASVVVPTTGLSTGRHYLFVRTINNSGTASLYEGRMFFIKPSIVAAEYFIDSDPGVGHATAISITASLDSVASAITVTSPALASGYHYLFVRTQNNNGAWSLYEGRKFYVKPTIVAAEYFVDTDPGAGAGHSIPVTATYDSISLNASVVTTSLKPGWHNLFVRTKNNSGGWSLYEGRRFYRKPLIVGAEYFVNVDPGVGAATPFTFTAGYDSVIVNSVATATCLDSGQHFLFIRSKDEVGNWSLYEPDTFFINLQTPVITTADTTVICSGQTVRMRVNMGGACVYQWFKNGIAITGATDSSYTALVIGTYTVQVTIGASNFISNAIDVTAGNCTNYVWNGTNTNWNDPINWNTNLVPNNCSANVIIPVTPHNPVLNSNIQTGAMQVDAGIQVTLNADLSVCGNWTGGTGTNGIVTGTGALILNGSNAQAISGKTKFNLLRLNNAAGAQMQSGSSVDVFTSLDLQSGTFATNGGVLTFLSTSVSQVAIIDNFSPGYSGSLNGIIHAQRYYGGGTSINSYNQHFMGSPVNSPSFSQFGASGTAGYIIPTANCDEAHVAANSPYSTVLALDETHGAICTSAQWIAETSSSGNAMNGQGYAVAKVGAGVLSLSGTANLNSSYTIANRTNSNWTNVTLQGHNIISGWHLVSNPYLATLDINTPSAGFDNQIQVWHSNGPFAGTYQSGIIGVDATVAPFQAFIVHKTTTVGTANYTLNASDRVRTPHSFFRANDNELKIVAENTNTHLLDQTTVAFNAAATEHFDPQFDANKSPGTLNRHTLYSLNDGQWMSRNILHDVANTSTVSVGFEPGATGTYNFAFTGVNTFDATSYIYLEDKALHTMHDVRNGDYSFTADSADAWDRFVLHFTPPAVMSITDAGCTTQGSINITQPGIANWNYTLADNGNHITASGMLNQSSPLTLSEPAGSYLLTLTDANNYAVTQLLQVNGPEPVTASFTSSATVVEESQSVVLSATSPNANSYQWNLGNGQTANGPTVTYNYTTPGTYTVVLTVSNLSNCSATASQTIEVNSSTSGFNTITGSKGIGIWSNGNKVFVDFRQQQKVDAVVTIYNVLGQQISNEKFNSNMLYQKEIGNIEAAYFTVSVKDNNQVTTKKVFVNNTR
ncbi:MAG: C-terminal target protein [Bacteroidota bacterium]|nr:C-terminal target protein [Bacteroidota bacterium]